MKKNLISGLILLLPITITIIVIFFLIDIITRPFLDNVKTILMHFSKIINFNLVQHAMLFIIISKIIALILLFLIVLTLGFFGNRILFRWVGEKIHKLMIKIPLINLIYKVCKDIISAILSDKKKLISRIVTVPFPSKETSAFGLVTGNAPHEVQEAHNINNPSEIIKSVFVPTSPHPISGFLLLTKEKHLKSIDMKLEDVFKFLISCGVFTTNPKNEDEHEIKKKSDPLSSEE